MQISDLRTIAPGQRQDHAAHSDAPIISASNIAVKFKVEGGIVDAVKDVSFQLYRGETIAIVGESRVRQIRNCPHDHGSSDKAGRSLRDGEDRL